MTDPGHATLEFTLAGNLSSSTWTVTPDNAGTGVDLVDPPPTSTAAGSAANPAVTTDGVSETFTFADPDSSDAQKVNVSPDGSNYAGIFSAGAVSESPGSVSVEFNFTVCNDHIDLQQAKR